MGRQPPSRGRAARARACGAPGLPDAPGDARGLRNVLVPSRCVVDRAASTHRARAGVRRQGHCRRDRASRVCRAPVGDCVFFRRPAGTRARGVHGAPSSARRTHAGGSGRDDEPPDAIEARDGDLGRCCAGRAGAVVRDHAHAPCRAALASRLACREGHGDGLSDSGPAVSGARGCAVARAGFEIVARSETARRPETIVGSTRRRAHVADGGVNGWIDPEQSAGHVGNPSDRQKRICPPASGGAEFLQRIGRAGSTTRRIDRLPAHRCRRPGAVQSAARCRHVHV